MRREGAMRRDEDGMTVSGTAAAPDVSGDAWTRAWGLWHLAFWLMLALGVVALITNEELSQARRNLALAVIAVIAVAYAGLRPTPSSVFPWRNVVYVAVVVLGIGVACAADSTLGFLLFIAYPQMWVFSGEIRNGVVLTGALTLSSAIGFLTDSGWTMHSFAVIGPSVAVSVVFSLMMGLWISRIIDQSRERADLINQLEATRTELGEAHHAQGVMAERERLAREIHDTLAQGFTSIIMLAQAARAEAEHDQNDQPPVTARLDSIELVARENLDEARALVAAFSPVALADTTLIDAVRRLVDRFGTETGVAIDVEVSAASAEALAALSRDREVVLLRAAQEALTNVRRHARAQLVTVRLTAEGAEALVEVEDDGVGFDPNTPGGFGLTGMRDRARDTGGDLDIASTPGRGTRVRVRVPVAAGVTP
jgi:signal transduction histidine kinase